MSVQNSNDRSDPRSQTSGCRKGACYCHDDKHFRHECHVLLGGKKKILVSTTVVDSSK